MSMTEGQHQATVLVVAIFVCNSCSQSRPVASSTSAVICAGEQAHTRMHACIHTDTYANINRERERERKVLVNNKLNIMYTQVVMLSSNTILQSETGIRTYQNQHVK